MSGAAPQPGVLEPERAGSSSPAPPVREEEVYVYPASFAQRRLWFLDRLEPGGSAYNVARAFRLRGELDRRSLGRALQAVVDRHEALRTTFAEGEEGPRQRIAAARRQALPTVDLARLPASRRERPARRLVARESAYPFDLARGPLLRTTLVRLAEDEHLLLLTVHHVVSDAWSAGVLVRELATLYRAFRRGRPATLPELPVQYADYAVWQHEWLEGGELERQVEHWRRRLAGAPPLLPLPWDRPRPPVQSFRGGHLPFDLPERVASALRTFAARHRATPFMALLAAYAALLGRWSGSDDVCVGAPVSGRTEPEVEGLVGFFVNTLVIRVDLGGEPTFAELLSRVRGAVLEAHDHQDVPFEKLVEALAPERSLSHAPLFQAALNLAEAPELGAGGEEGGLAVEPLEVEHPVAKFDLTLAVAEHGDRLSGSLEYAADLFDRTTAARFSDQLRRLLRHAVLRPDDQPSRASLLSDAQRHQLLHEWSSASSGAEPLRPLRWRLRDRVALEPDAVALSAEGETLSRSELAERAGALARWLRHRGVGPDVPVGLCLDRSPALVVAILAVVEAGGTWVPLDPDYPEARLRWLLEDAGAALLLTHRELLDRVGDLGLPRALLDRGGRLEVAPPHAGEAGSAGTPHPESLACVISTSGSTGRPKGVGIPYRGLEALVRWAEVAFDERERRRVAAVTSVCFDLSTFELLAPLCAGGSVVLLPDALALSAPRAHGVTLVNTVPSAAAELLERDGLPATALAVNLAGEALRRELADRLHRRGPRWRLRNLYGPSEDTTYSTQAEVPPGEPGEPRIGRPVAGARARVVDRGLRLTPPGVTGEVTLGGAGLARGYLGRPGPTAERFVPDPWAGAVGERLYRTGDLVRQGADGRLEFLGRADHQVKVRGFRIEPGEVEAALAEAPGVEECVVVPREDPAGGLRLVAYVAGTSVETRELRRSLEARLPAHMVPALLAVLPSLPKTPNGKVDRAALPEPDPGTKPPAGSPGFRSPDEELVAEIWAGVLGLGAVGSDDDFFALGGHSLLASRALARIRESFGVELPLRTLFQAPTVASFAAEVASRRGAGGPGAPPLEPVERDGPLPVSYAQRRLWFLDRLEPGNPAYNLSAGLALTGELDGAALAAAIVALGRRHESLRTRFEERDGEPLQGVEAGVGWTCRLARIDLERLPEPVREREARRAAGVLGGRGFDLGRAPLARFGLLRLAPRDHVLLLTLHHAVADGWSLEVLAQDLAELYRAAAAGRLPELPALPVQYCDFAAWQRRWLAGEALEARLAPWRRALEELPATLELPTDRPRPPVRSSAGAARPVGWSEELTGRLRRLARDTGTTLFMVALTAFEALLHRHSGTDDLAVGTPVAGRDHVATERVVGCFVNTLVLRARLHGSPTVRELLERTRETVLEAHAHRDVPFEVLVEALAPARSLAHTPLFQVLFSFWSGGAAVPEIPGVAVEPVPASGGTAKFDLLLALEDRGGGVAGSLEYARDLFDGTTAERLVRHLTTLLEAFAGHPDGRLADHPLLSRAEAHQVRWELSDTALVPAPPGLLHEGFADRAVRTPDRIALRHGDRHLTYAELDRRASRVAVRLSALGAGPEARVEICLERGPDLVAALLGILRAGAAYVPLDPAYPPRRLAALAEVSGAGWLLTRRGLFPAPLPRGRQVLLADDLLADRALRGPAAAPARLRPENLAYVIFSSGSTGTPKGVAIEHRSAWSLVRWARGVFGDDELAVSLASTSVCFDLSVFEIFVPLSAGGTVVLAETVLDLPSLPAAERVTLVNTVPSAMAELLELGPLPPSVRTVNLAGEVLEGAVADRVLAGGGVRRLLNLYGPSEDTTYTTVAAVRPDRTGEPTLGRPVDDTRIRLLDRTLRPVPRGVSGELCVAGAGSARGYLGRPALTAGRWVPDPLAEAAGGRLYRTGDLARHLADGELELLGRLDHQVKVRGFRIELGEVETALASHEAVRDVAVVASGGSVRDRKLAAFVVFREGADLQGGELRNWLGRRLPRFAVPSSFAVLDRLPRTPHGKVDRRALVALAEEGPEAVDGEVRAPRDSVEMELVDLVSDLLGRRTVGVEDDFFELGGHSLLAVRLAAGIRRRFGRTLVLSDLFRYPTVEGMAGLVRRGAGPGRRSPLVPMGGRGDGPPLFLVHPVGGNVLCYRSLAARVGPEHPVIALESPAVLGDGEPPRVLEEMAAGYLEAVAEARPGGELLLGGWSSGGVIAFEMARQAVERGRRVGPLLLVDSFAPADVPRHDEEEILLLHAWSFGLEREGLEHLALNERIDFLVRELRRQRLVAADVEAGDVRRLLRAYHRNLEAVVAYRPRPYPGPMVLFRSTEAEDYGGYGDLFGRGVSDPEPEWRRLAAGPFTVVDVAGTHNGLVSEPRVAELAAAMTAALAAGASRGPAASTTGLGSASVEAEGVAMP